MADERRSETTEGMVVVHLLRQQTLRIRDENLVETQATRAQFRGSSSSLKNMFRTTSSESLAKTVSSIFERELVTWVWCENVKMVEIEAFL